MSQNKKLYHFTAERFLRSIQKSGLTRGKMLKTFRPLSFIDDCQWLTENPNFDQSWLNPNSTLPYKRNEVRLAIDVPPTHFSHLKKFSSLKFLVPDVFDDLTAYGDPWSWYVYFGKIPPHWIVRIENSLPVLSE